MKNLFLRKNNNIKSGIYDVLTFSLIIATLCFMLSFVPILSITLYFIIAFSVILSYRNGFLLSSLGLFLIINPVLFLSFGTINDIILIYLLIMSGIILGDVLFYKKNVTFAVFGTTFFLAFAIAYMYSQGFDILQTKNMISAITQNLDVSNLSSLGVSINQESVSIVEEILPTLVTGSIMSISFIYIIFAYYLCSDILSPQFTARVEFGEDKISVKTDFVPFRYFSMPRMSFLTLLAFSSIFAFIPNIVGYSPFSIQINIYMMLATIFYVQGLAAIDFYVLNRLNKFVKLAVFAVLTTLLMGFFPFIAILGFFDMIIFRRMEKKD